MSNSFRQRFRGSAQQDHPIPVGHNEDIDTKFDIIRDNIEILWKRVSDLIKSKPSDLVSSGGSSGSSSSSVINNITNTVDQKKASIYDEVGNRVILSSWEDLLFDSQNIIDPVFSNTPGNGIFTVNENGDYELSVDFGMKSENDGDQVIELRLMVDTGSGYSEINGSRAYCKM